jgi:hypothetical protein
VCICKLTKWQQWQHQYNQGLTTQNRVKRQKSWQQIAKTKKSGDKTKWVGGGG